LKKLEQKSLLRRAGILKKEKNAKNSAEKTE
jgi:hypothetical protein